MREDGKEMKNKEVIMSERCQSCCKEILFYRQQDVKFSNPSGVVRVWTMCPDCAAKLQNLVLGFMGELPPKDIEPSPGIKPETTPFEGGCGGVL